MKRTVTYTTPPGELLTATPESSYQPISGTAIANIISAAGLDCRCANTVVAPQLVHYDMNLTDILQYNETKLNKIMKAIGARYHGIATLTSSNIADFGVDISRTERAFINLRSGLYTTDFNNASRSSACIGVDTTNHAVVVDIANAPHMLIAGTTGSGKSVLLNSLLCSLLYKITPFDGKLILIDPKMIELGRYKNLPHLYCPIITDSSVAVKMLADLCVEMDERYQEMNRLGVKDISETNYPRLYVVIDELADLMLTSKKSVEHSIVRIASKARAAGIHLIIATQRPSVNVVTGLIKANIPCKISLAVSNVHDSMVILDHGGAEKLTGRGDAIIKTGNSIIERRFQALFTPDSDIDNIVSYYAAMKQEPPKRKGLFGLLAG